VARDTTPQGPTAYQLRMRQQAAIAAMTNGHLGEPALPPLPPPAVVPPVQQPVQEAPADVWLHGLAAVQAAYPDLMCGCGRLARHAALLAGTLYGACDEHTGRLPRA
jgi:hypothetical protein